MMAPSRDSGDAGPTETVVQAVRAFEQSRQAARRARFWGVLSVAAFLTGVDLAAWAVATVLSVLGHGVAAFALFLLGELLLSTVVVVVSTVPPEEVKWPSPPSP